MSTAPSNLDLVFLMDTTASMSPYLNSAKENVQSIVRQLVDSGKVAVRFGVVAYRDHPPEDHTYVTRVFPLTSSQPRMQAYVDGLSAQGGGDGPEALTAALAEVESLSFQEDAAKVVVLITDAPPHGAGELFDGFPGGDPMGRDPLVVARRLATAGVVLYSVGCEPVLSQYCNARGLLVALAQLTGGQAICLGSAGLLAEVILGGSLEEVALQGVARQVQDQLRALEEEHRQAGRDVTSPEVSEAITTSLYTALSDQGCEVPTLATDGRMTDPRASIFAAAATLREAVEEARKQFGDPEPQSPLSSYSTPGMSECPTAPATATHCTVTHSPVSVEQCSRLVMRSPSARVTTSAE